MRQAARWRHQRKRLGEAELDPEGPAAKQLESLRRGTMEPCPRRHAYRAPCDVCGGSTRIQRAPQAPEPDPDPELHDFLVAASLLEAHGVLPAPGGWLDQTEWFIQAYAVFGAETERLRSDSDAFDAKFRREQSERQRRQARSQ